MERLDQAALAANRCCDVPLEHLPFIWPKVERYIKLALDFDDCGRYAPIDIFELLLRGECRLWIAYDHGREEFDGAAVTQIIQSPRCRECRCWLVGGKNLRLWQEEMRLMLEDYARAAQCQYMTGSGRKGWLHMPGYKAGGIIFQKAL